MPNYEFPHIIDNTFVSAFRRCERYGYYQSIRRIKPNNSSTHLIAGAAFARGLEIVRRSYFEQGKSFQDSLDAGVVSLLVEYGEHEPPKSLSVKNAWNMAAALTYYFDTWPINESMRPLKLGEAKHAIEFSFAIPLPVKHPVTGDPLLFSGKCDFIGEHEKHKVLYAVDEKTSTSLGEHWINNWIMNSQMTGYVWAGRQLGYPLVGALVRGVGILSKSFSHAEVLVLRPQWRLDEWQRNLELTLYKAIAAWKHEQFQQNLDAACNQYGGCSYRQLCEVQHPEDWIEINFQPNTWNPLHSRG